MYGAIVRLGLFRTAMGRVLCIYLDLFIVATGTHMNYASRLVLVILYFGG
jgi:hypothetical protein